MRRLIPVLVIALLTASCSADAGDNAADADATTTTASGASTTSAPATTTTTVPAGAWHLAWQPTALVDGFAAALAAIDGVGAVSMVRVGDAWIVETARADGTIVDRPPDGWFIPVEVHAVDGAAHAGFLPETEAATLASMGDDEVLLGSTSAALRRLQVGDSLTFAGGRTVTVAGIVDDRYVGDAEVVTARSDPEVFTNFLDKYAVFWFEGRRSDLEAAVLSIEGEPVTVRGPGEVLVYRHGDSVRSQVAFKDRFGEFTIRPTGDGFDQERAWRDANIATERIPLIGTVTCHRDFTAMLRDAMTALEEQGKGAVINPASFLGCWNPRFIAGRQAISHHSFGAAADINFFEPVDGPYSPTDPDLLVALYAAGLTSGHLWVNPDPGHFEWYDG